MPLWWCVAWTSTSLPLSVPRNLAPLSKLVVLSWRRLKKGPASCNSLPLTFRKKENTLTRLTLERPCVPRSIHPRAPVEVEVLEA